MIDRSTAHYNDSFRAGLIVSLAAGLLVALGACRTNPAGDLPELVYTAPVNAYVGQTVVLDASASSDPEGELDVFSFDFGDGSGASRGPSPIIDHVYNAVGDYLTSVSVIDQRGNKLTELRTITIVDPKTAPFLLCQEDRPYCPPLFNCDTATYRCEAEAVWCSVEDPCAAPQSCEQGVCTLSQPDELNNTGDNP